MKLFVRTLSIIMTLLMMLSLLSCGNETASSDSSLVSSEGEETKLDMANVWDGSFAEGVAEGQGTEADPFIINTPSELAYAVNDGSKQGYHYQLAGDIYLNDVSDTFWMLSESNNLWLTSGQFEGTIDGKGYCIYGLWIQNESRPDDGGLVSDLLGGGFRNLGIRYSYISAKNYAGAFAGRVSGGKSVFENCFADDTVYVQYTDMGRNGAGGIIGYACAGGTNRSTIDFINCYSKANVLGLGVVERVNGLIGTSWNCAYTMKNCYSVGLAPYCGKNENTASYLLAYGWKTEDVYQNIYTDKRAPREKEVFTLLTLEEMSDRSKMALDFESDFKIVEGSTPKISFFDISGAPAKEVLEMPYYRYLSMEFSGGMGTEDDPFMVSNRDQLLYVVSGYWENTYFKMANDIHINDITNPKWQSDATEWTQSSSNCFGGNFDGNGHAVHGIYLKDTTDSVSSDYGTGLFPKISTTAVIKNVSVKNSVITGKCNVGAIAGTMVKSDDSTEFAQIIGCTADESVTLKGYAVGGILGSTLGGVKISGCTSGANIEGTNKGEILGKAYSDNYEIK